MDKFVFTEERAIRRMEFNKLNSDDAKGLKAIFRALNHRNFRLFLAAKVSL